MLHIQSRFAKNSLTKASGNVVFSFGYAHEVRAKRNPKSAIRPTIFQVILLQRANSSPQVCFVPLLSLEPINWKFEHFCQSSADVCKQKSPCNPLVKHVKLNVCSNAAVDVSGYKVNAGVVYWDVKGDRLSVGVAATGYYVGFGINDKGPRMSGADIALCREFQVRGFANSRFLD